MFINEEPRATLRSLASVLALGQQSVAGFVLYGTSPNPLRGLRLSANRYLIRNPPHYLFIQGKQPFFSVFHQNNIAFSKNY